jgi:hypothetical protein
LERARNVIGPVPNQIANSKYKRFVNK